MQKYFDNVTNRNGVALPNATVTVTLTSSGALATIYSDNGVTPKTNPITCDPFGYYEFYAENGRYTLTFNGPGITGRSITDVQLDDAPEAATDAAASAAAAEVSRQAIDNRIYPGTYAADPTTRPDGTVIQNGDEYVTTAGTVKVRSAGVWATPTVNMTDLANSSDATKGAALVGHEQTGSTVASRLDSLSGQIEGRQNQRNLFKTLYAQVSAATPFALTCWGDSVAPRVWKHVLREFRKFYGDGGNLFPIMDSIQGNLTYTSTGTVTQSTDPAGSAVADYQYLPNGGHFVLATSATVTFTDNDHSNYTKLIAWFSKRPGDGSAVVDVLNASTSAVISTQTIVLNGTNKTLASAVFTGLDPSVPVKLKITASGGPVLLLTVGFLRSSGVIGYGMSRGSTTVTQQVQADSTIVAGILADINAVMMFHEDKEEAATTSYPTLMSYMAAIPSVDQLFIGSLPDSTAAATQRTIRNILRTQALGSGFAYFNGYAAFGPNAYTEVTRLGWNGDGTHLDDAAYFFVAQQVLMEMKASTYGAILRIGEVVADNFSVNRTDGNISSKVRFTAWSASVPYAVDLQNVRRVAFQNTETQASGYLEPFSNFAVTFRSAAGAMGVARMAQLTYSGGGYKTTVTAGAATALPATPATYFAVELEGVTRYVPAYLP